MKSSWQLSTFLHHNFNPTIFLTAVGIVATIGESIGGHRFLRSPSAGRHGIGNALCEQPFFHRIGAALGELWLYGSDPFLSVCPSMVHEAFG